VLAPQSSSQAKLLEHNVRFGDPECQSLMVRLQSDLLESVAAQCRGEQVGKQGGVGGGRGGGRARRRALAAVPACREALQAELDEEQRCLPAAALPCCQAPSCDLPDSRADQHLPCPTAGEPGVEP
jgi:hypothetical protein